MSAAIDRRLRRVQLQLDVGVIPSRPDGITPRPRPIKFAMAQALRELVDPSTLVELSAPERRQLYDLADLSPLRRAEVEDAVRRAVRRRYRRAS